MTDIACPMALHPDGAARRIAICLHPHTGPQLMKAAFDADPAGSAARALYSMSMLETRAALPIGTAPDIAPETLWHFALCRIVPPVRERWQHLPKGTTDLLQFTWMPLDTPPLDGFDTADLRALDWIKAAL